MPANPGKAALQRGDACRLRSVAGAVGAGGEIEPDRLRVGRQLWQTLPAKPGGKMSPIGVVSALGVVGPGGSGVVFSGLGERGEAIVLRGARRGQNGFVDICSVYVLVFPTTRRTVRGVV